MQSMGSQRAGQNLATEQQQSGIVHYTEYLLLLPIWLKSQLTFVEYLVWCKHLQFSSAQSLSRVRLFATPWTAPRQASLSNTNSQSLLKLMSIKSVMPFNHLILCGPLLLLPSIFLSMRVFSNVSVIHIRWPKYWSFCFITVLSMKIQD